MRAVKSTLFIFIFIASLFADVFISEFKATPETNRVTISWTTKAETNVKLFKIMRSNDDRTFIEIESVNAKGPGTHYIVVDENVMFKSSALFYKIKVLDNSNNILEETSSKIVHPNTTGMFRTWGAIKAMFR